jgi:hypothetical protein
MVLQRGAHIVTEKTVMVLESKGCGALSSSLSSATTRARRVASSLSLGPMRVMRFIRMLSGSLESLESKGLQDCHLETLKPFGLV